ncbi:PDZ domain-containing protein, partial [Zeaxanthinibacter enoshimensis]|uniref:PDZ domain-containing protein n=1 Tax=Zeaxanthinibacter enoshimensis TaxID=392009 RepID=UPI0035683098
MRRNLTLGFLVILIAVASCSFTNKSFETNDKDKLLLDLITYVLERGHYEPKNINDDFSVNVFEDFINVIDPTKRYFLKEDIAEFEQYKFQIDDQIKNTDITFFEVVYDRLMKRMDEAKTIYKEILAEPFDYSANESIDIDYEKQDFAASKAELRERWRKQLKLNTIGTYDSKLNSSTEEDDTEKPSKEQIEKEAREATLTTLNEFFDFVDDLERKDWFVQYINTIVDEFDPHTYYFAPEDKDKFDISMSGKFEGIGARLQKKAEGARIVEIISGGPVWRNQQLEVGDEILKVGQNGEPPVNIVGMRLDDAIKL